MAKVTIALPTFNRASFLEDCVKSVLHQSFHDYEFIIMDDCSKDDTSKVAEKLCRIDPRIRYYRNNIHMGLPRSRNIAVGLSQADFVFFIEDDLILHHDCLEALLKAFGSLSSSGIRVGAVGPKLMKGNIRRYVRTQQKVAEVNKFTGMIRADFNINGGLVEVPTLHSCSLIYKAVFKDVGGYDYRRYKGTNFREETDFYFRTRRAGYKLFYQPKAVVSHRKVSVGGCRIPPFPSGYFEVRNHVLFITKFYGIMSIFMLPCYLTYVASHLGKFLAQSRQ
jgi:glycosyltransferase involved in cell wall biosynthesis